MGNHRREIPMKNFIWCALVLFIFTAGSCGPTATAHVYTNKTGGSVVWCPEELDPVPTEWDYNGTAEVQADQILEQCELE